jgi:uncharacterized integral membrane protein
MLSETRSTPVDSPVGGAIPDTSTDPVSDWSLVATDPDLVPAEASDVTAIERETRRDRSRRKAHRARLHSYAIVTVALVAFLLALAASNTAQVKANWVFGSSHVSLVWLVLFAAILGWLLGLAATAAFHWRTRAPRSSRQLATSPAGGPVEEGNK